MRIQHARKPGRARSLSCEDREAARRCGGGGGHATSTDGFGRDCCGTAWIERYSQRGHRYASFERAVIQATVNARSGRAEQPRLSAETAGQS